MRRFGWLVAGIGIGTLGVLGLQAVRRRLPGVIQGKILPHDPVVRRKAIEIASQHPGEYNIEQVLDVFDYMKALNYVTDPQPTHVAFPKDTILAGGGDCDDFAVTAASLIEAVGGHSRVVVVWNENIGHALTEVHMGSQGTITSHFLEPIRNRYGDVQVGWECDNENNEWLVFDTLLSHPGMLPQDFVRINSSKWNWLPEMRVQYFYR